MAIVFELAVNTGPNHAEALVFSAAVKARYQTYQIGSHAISLHEPLINAVVYGGQKSFVVSIVPVGVGAGVAIDAGHSTVRLTKEQLSQLGIELYGLLKTMDGYEIALLGWDPDWISLGELASEWLDDIIAGRLHGLVVAQHIAAQLPPSDFFERFDDWHVWIPYQGTSSLWQ